MIYILKSDSNFIINNQIKNIKKEKEINSENVFTFDFEENEKMLNNVLLEYFSISFDKQNKLVILKNANFLNKSNIDSTLKKSLKNLFELKNENTLIMTINKLEKKSFFSKNFKNGFSIIEKDSPKGENLVRYLLDFFGEKEVKINIKNIEYIIKKIDNEFDILMNEVQKLILLNEGNNITEKNIDEAIMDFSRERLYKISEYVIKKDVKKISKLIKQFKEEGEGIYLIVDFLVKEFSKFFWYYQLLSEKKYLNSNSIQKMTNWNIWSIKNYEKWIHNWNSKELDYFFKEIIIEEIFLNLILNSSNESLSNLEKILVSNLIYIT